MNHSNKLVSIIIPCFNYGNFLHEAIESVLAQTYNNYEILVIDDGSTDDTKTIASKFKNKIKYYYKRNGGDSDARNYGLTKAMGEYIVFLDADNKLDENFLVKTLNFIESNNNIAYVYTQLKYFGLLNGQSKFDDYNLEKLKYNNFIDACALIKSYIFHHVKYDINFKVFQDWDFYLSLSEKGFKGKLLDEPLVYYRKHETSQISKLKDGSLSNERNAYIKIFLKHKKLYNTIFLIQWILGHYILAILENLKLKSK